MRKFLLLLIIALMVLVFMVCSDNRITYEFVSSTEGNYWIQNENVKVISKELQGNADIEILTDEYEQTIDGFGACFNELGWEALKVLDEDIQSQIFKDIFSEEGCNYTICRMPIGANDFAVDWYSLNEHAGDYQMEKFSIARDRQRLIPFIKSAQAVRPDLKIWGSPWCPPSWMKKNGYYACSPSKWNEMDPSVPRRENGETEFITDEKTQKAYALYFQKYIEAYQAEGIDVFAVHVQNEPHSCQWFPACLWKGDDLKNFIRDYLAPHFKKNNMDTEIWYGTFERPYKEEFQVEIDMLLADKDAMSVIEGFGFQWAGKDAIDDIHRLRPDVKLMHTEVECGDGKNTWEHAEYDYELLKHYFDHGANSQMYWNLALKHDQISTWGWRQNSMVTVNTETKELTYNPEFYVMKHFSHYIKPGAKKLKIKGNRTSELAFLNSDHSIILLLHNSSDKQRVRTIKIDNHVLKMNLLPKSINTLKVNVN